LPTVTLPVHGCAWVVLVTVIYACFIVRFHTTHCSLDLIRILSQVGVQTGGKYDCSVHRLSGGCNGARLLRGQESPNRQCIVHCRYRMVPSTTGWIILKMFYTSALANIMCEKLDICENVQLVLLTWRCPYRMCGQLLSLHRRRELVPVRGSRDWQWLLVMVPPLQVLAFPFLTEDERASTLRNFVGSYIQTVGNIYNFNHGCHRLTSSGSFKCAWMIFVPWTVKISLRSA
jgi:hypothetical protein